MFAVFAVAVETVKLQAKLPPPHLAVWGLFRASHTNQTLMNSKPLLLVTFVALISTSALSQNYVLRSKPDKPPSPVNPKPELATTKVGKITYVEDLESTVLESAAMSAGGIEPDMMSPQTGGEPEVVVQYDFYDEAVGKLKLTFQGEKCPGGDHTSMPPWLFGFKSTNWFEASHTDWTNETSDVHWLATVYAAFPVACGEHDTDWVAGRFRLYSENGALCGTTNLVMPAYSNSVQMAIYSVENISQGGGGGDQGLVNFKMHPTNVNAFLFTNYTGTNLPVLTNVATSDTNGGEISISDYFPKASDLFDSKWVAEQQWRDRVAASRTFSQDVIHYFDGFLEIISFGNYQSRCTCGICNWVRIQNTGQVQAGGTGQGINTKPSWMPLAGGPYAPSYIVATNAMNTAWTNTLWTNYLMAATSMQPFWNTETDEWDGPPFKWYRSTNLVSGWAHIIDDVGDIYQRAETNDVVNMTNVHAYFYRSQISYTNDWCAFTGGYTRRNQTLCIMNKPAPAGWFPFGLQTMGWNRWADSAIYKIPHGSEIGVWNGSGYDYYFFDPTMDPDVSFWFDEYWNPCEAPFLYPGVGFLFYNPSSDGYITTAGIAPSGTNCTKISPNWQLLCSQIPIAGGFDDEGAGTLNLPLDRVYGGDQIQKWNGSSWDTYFYDPCFDPPNVWFDDQWSPVSEPQVELGEAFFYYSAQLSGTNTLTWTQWIAD